jgi:hypothetical protein
MAALTQPRDTAKKHHYRYVDGPVAANVKIYAGAMVCRNATGGFVPASDTAGLSAVVGRAEFTVDNTGGALGALHLTVCKGVFAYDLSANLLAAAYANLGKAVEVQDDHTVALAADAGTVNNISGGTLDEVDLVNALYYILI